MSKLRWWILRRFNALHLGLDWMSSFCGSWVDGARCPCQRLWLNFDRTTTHNQYSIWYHVQPNISASWLLKYFFLPSNMVFTRRFVGGGTSWSFGARFSTAWGTLESVNGHPDITIQVLPELVIYCLISFDVVWCSFVHSCAILIFMADFFDQNPSCWHVSPPGSHFSWAWDGIGKEVGCSGDDLHSQGLHVTTSICGGCGVVFLFLFCGWLTGSLCIFIFVYMYIKYTSLGWSVGWIVACKSGSFSLFLLSL